MRKKLQRSPTILLISHDTFLVHQLETLCSELSLKPSLAKTGEEFLEQFSRQPFDFIVSELVLEGALDGIDVMEHAKTLNPNCLVILITAHGTVEKAVEAMRLGVYDFLQKPISFDHLRSILHRGIEQMDLIFENLNLKKRIKEVTSLTDTFVYQSQSMKQIVDMIRTIAPTDTTVLLKGESGTGKELLAQAIHNFSSRDNGPFIPVNCGSIPETLFESELFGFEPGAFTGAHKSKKGFFELAHGGTIFLDEITEIPENNQVDLLRVIQEREVVHVGGESKHPIDIRIIAATNQDIEKQVAEGTFREDLFYRLNIVPVEVPPLRERKEDIPFLTTHFLDQFCALYKKKLKSLSPEALERFMSYSWPGNVRQLRNIIERLIVTLPADIIELKHVPREITAGEKKARENIFNLQEVLNEAERETIQRALAESRKRREDTAHLLGISPRMLYYKLKKYNI